MTLEEAKTTFYGASTTLSDTIRKLCFAGIAIIWIFKVGDKTAGGITFSPTLLIPLRIFIIGLIFDGLQYLYKCTAWWIYYAIKHGQDIADDAVVHPPGILNGLTQLLFYAKVACCAYGYYGLIRFISAAIEHPAMLK